jgi:hypothetical protein
MLDEMDFSTNFALEKHLLFYEYIPIMGKVFGKDHASFPSGTIGYFQWMLILKSCCQR